MHAQISGTNPERKDLFRIARTHTKLRRGGISVVVRLSVVVVKKSI